MYMSVCVSVYVGFHVYQSLGAIPQEPSTLFYETGSLIGLSLLIQVVWLPSKP